MNVESLKVFGTWLSNMAYWVLEPLLGDSDEEALAIKSTRPRSNYYGSRAEALANGAMHQMCSDDGGPGFYL